MSFAWTAISVAIVGSITSVSLGLASQSAQKKAAKRQLEAQAMDTKIKAEQRIKQTRRLAAQNKSSFLASGISLTGDGTADAVISDTYQTGMDDVENIKKFGAVQGENITARARANMIAGYGQMVSDVTGYASMGLQGAGSLKSAGGALDIGGGLEGMGDSYGGLEGMGSGSAFGSGTSGFGSFDNYGAIPKGFGGI